MPSSIERTSSMFYPAYNIHINMDLWYDIHLLEGGFISVNLYGNLLMISIPSRLKCLVVGDLSAISDLYENT